MMTDSLARINPYVIGRPIDEQQLLFGRENIFQFIEENLKLGVKVIFLYGQRRIGLSSILSNIPKYVAPGEFVFVTLDIQEYNKEPFSALLHTLITDIITYLNIDTTQIKLPSSSESETEIEKNYYLSQVFKKLEKKRIVLLIKEIDSLEDNIYKLKVEKLCRFLHSIIQHQDKLFLIFLIRGELTDESYLFNLFQDALYQEVGLLDHESAKQLIIKPAEDILEYDEDAVTAILQLSAGHPYFIQVICFTLFVQARIENNWKITSADVEAIVDKSIESGEAGLAWLWNGISIPERVVFSAVAEAQRIAFEKKQLFPKEPLTLLKELGVAETNDLIDAATKLVDKGFLDDTGCRIKIELIRRWLLQRHPLDKQILELEVLEQEKVILFDKTLEIESKRRLAPQKLREINLAYHIVNIRAKQRQLILLSAIVAVGILAFISIGFYRWFSPCTGGQYKVNDICCEANQSSRENSIKNNISCGNRTLFHTIPNQYRDQGVKAFKQGNYQQAVQFFDKAVVTNPNDPEVLIYYNNALARKQGSPFTFAVVVPVQQLQSVAQEVLRGVALAQKEFNDKGGFNNRLLEIIIANDANNPEQATQIAKQLVDDKSVLAVIGHSTSEATGSALYEYQKAKQPLAIISPTSASSLLQGDIFFRTVPSNVQLGQQLAEYVWNQLGLQKVVIFYNRDKSLFSNDLREQFTNKFEQLGGQVVWLIDLAETKLDAAQKLNESVSKYQAQAALLLPDAQYTSIALELAKAKANSNNPKVQSLKLLGSSTLYSDTTLINGGDAIEGLILSIPWLRKAPPSKNFAQKAFKQWKEEISWPTATSYDATQALLKALSSNPSPSRATVLQELRKVNLSPQKTSGKSLKFTPEREIEMEPILVKIEGGKFKILGSAEDVMVEK